MEVIRLIIQVITAIVCSMVAVMSIVLFLQFRWPAAVMWGSKVLISALSSLFALIGLLAFIIGVVTGSVFISVAGIYVTFIYLLHIISVTRSPGSASGFEQAFGFNWKNRIKPEQKNIFFHPVSY